MNIYLINWVCSEGFYDGSETVTFLGTDPKDVIRDAYKQYASEAAEASRSGSLDPDCDVLSEKEFESIMDTGFALGKNNRGNFALLQLYECHMQFEPLCLSLGPDIIDRSSFIASKLWSREDVLGVLSENGFEGTEAEIDAVINTGMLDSLNDCTDNDWEIIGSAVREAERRGDIREGGAA